MRMTRFIVMAAILCAGMAGQGDAQKPAKRATNTPPEDLARQRQQQATFDGLLGTWEKCIEQLSSGADKARWCDMHQEELRQTPLDALVSPDVASKLNATLTAKEIESLKVSISNAATAGYYYGKEKGRAGR